MEFIATCPKGFERPLAAELSGLGCSQVRPLKGQVSFVSNLAGAYRACLWSRLASHVVLVLCRVDATSSDALYASLCALDWTEHLGVGSSVAVDAHGTNQELRNTRFVALRSKDAIVDTMLAKTGARPRLDVAHPDVTVVVRVTRSHALVGRDLAGEPLFRRGYEALPGRRAPIAPLRPDYAAMLLAEAGWTGPAAGERDAHSLFVVFPGAGTLLVEAAGIALDRAPGLARTQWGFSGWCGHDAAAWEAVLADARQRAERSLDVPLELFALDQRRGAEGSARQMLRAAGMDVPVRWVGAAQPADAVVSDLSWLDPDRLPLEADALATLSATSLTNEGACLAVLGRDAVVDAAVGREAASVTDVLVGRDDAQVRGFAPAPGGISRPSVELAGERLPLYVEASDQFAARLRKVAKQRAKWARREDVTCYRVYDSDLPDYAVTIDVFEESMETARERPRRWVQVYEYAAPREVDPALARKRLLDVLAIVPRVLGVDARDVFVRTRVHAKGGAQYAEEAKGPSQGRARMVAGAELAPGAHLVDEGGLTFEVNFQQRLDCGIFLDHRDTRARLREMAKRTAGSKRFLNLFAYTGTATCYAADGGAKHTTTVDLSRPSLEWAKRNMARNGFVGREHEFVQADVLQWVSEQRRTANRWDLVFCDVPTFSNSQRMRKGSFDVQRDHAELLIGISRLLTRGKDGSEGGVCVFSCNLRTFRPDVEALAKAGVSLEDITEQTIPEDFSRNRRIHHCYLVRRT